MQDESENPHLENDNLQCWVSLKLMIQNPSSLILILKPQPFRFWRALNICSLPLSLLSQEPVFASVYSINTPQYIMCFNQVIVWAGAWHCCCLIWSVLYAVKGFCHLTDSGGCDVTTLSPCLKLQCVTSQLSVHTLGVCLPDVHFGHESYVTPTFLCACFWSSSNGQKNVHCTKNSL